MQRAQMGAPMDVSQLEGVLLAGWGAVYRLPHASMLHHSACALC